MKKTKTTVTAFFPGGIGKVEISKERAEKILWLKKIIREHEQKTAASNQIPVTSNK